MMQNHELDLITGRLTPQARESSRPTRPSSRGAAMMAARFRYLCSHGYHVVPAETAGAARHQGGENSSGRLTIQAAFTFQNNKMAAV